MTYRVARKTLMASLTLAILVFSPLSAPLFAQQADPGVVTNLVIEVQQLQDEVRMLRGQLEEQARELENLKRRQRDQYLDLDQRLSDNRGTALLRPTDSTEPVSEASSETTSEREPMPMPAPAEDAPEVRAPLESQSAVAGIGEPQVRSQSGPAAELDAKAAYDQAFQALKELRYADAAEAFQSFLESYPNSEYADNAQYWLGESYYVTRNYDIALDAFQDLMDRYPDSPKVADALLKIGYTHYEMKQWDQARAALTQVQENYPDTTLARLAENRLRSMRMEGHY
ncbi:MAG: tol-pal system protein YbgF [Xanthomonadales bacterium]|nr:tol-pal system protein YbgF [Xanthomonadales bacterium]